LQIPNTEYFKPAKDTSQVYKQRLQKVLQQKIEYEMQRNLMKLELDVRLK
jgi:hypothetical protein